MSNIIEVSFISLSLYKFLGKKYLLTTLSAYYLYLLYSKKISSIRLTYFRERLQHEIKAENKFYDIVNNIQTVKYFQGESKENSNYSKAIKEVSLKDEKVSKSLAQLNIGQNCILNSFITINMLSAISDIRKGLITPGDMFMMQGFFNQLMAPLHIMGFLMREIDESRTQLQYGIDIKKKQMMLLNKTKEHKPDIEYRKGVITFKNVSFNYNPKTQVLKNINAIFEPGKLNCIVGESGQGKTTMFDLIYKLFIPISGKILIDDQDINSYNDKSIRDLLTICPQNGSLFNESIQYNMMYGYNNENNNNKGVNKMLNILKQLNLFRKINLMPEGLNTNVGSLGGKLSGGEKQRVLFIRALMKSKAKIFLLDEPTSNLDTKNELIVNDIIKSKLNKNTTIIITAHKLSTMKNADKIFVLDKGTIVESGNHNELIQKKGAYYKMITKSQSLTKYTSIYKH
jgi:ABC-type transport system involved in Fe-S cluster assembly fused permease/ATPase subunit